MKTSPLAYPATLLSIGSLAWTTWSLVDLLGAGPIGLTVAAGADVVWASVIVAEAQGLRIAGRRWTVTAIGWAALAAVAALLVWHGLSRGELAMAAAGPLLPLGAKVVWLLAINGMRDPAALTDDERAVLARMERGLAFEEAQHRVEMRRRAMTAELLLAEVDTDYSIERARQDKARELTRHRMIPIGPAQPVEPLIEPTAHPVEPPTQHTPTVVASSLVTPPEPQAPTFGFSAHVADQSAQRAEAVAKVAELLAQDPGLTSGQVAEELAVSPATAKRYLREARQAR